MGIALSFLARTVDIFLPNSAALSTSDTQVHTAAHRVLVCEELVQHILKYLIEPNIDDVDEGRGALVSLATVCRAVSVPALATLWERLDTINPIVALYNAESCLTREPSSRIPPRLLQYARYVRCIEIDSGTVPPALLTDKPLFPHLRRLHWVVDPVGTIQPFAAFIVPSLSELRIDASSGSSGSSSSDEAKIVKSLLDALEEIKVRHLALTSFELRWIYAPLLPASGAILEALSSLATLKTLCVSANTIAVPCALRILSKLPSLHSLYITHWGEDYDQPTSFDTTDGGFDALEKLRLDVPYPYAYGILHSMPVCKVRECTISLQGDCSDRNQREIVEELANNIGDSVATLNLAFPDDEYISDPGTYHPLSIDVFSALWTLKLTDVRLAWLQSEMITDQLCKDMSISWPRLHTLHLRPVGIVREPPPTMVTLRGIRYLAENCPDLSDVVIQINATGDYWVDEARSISRTVSPKSVSLDLTTSLVTSPQSVAIYLRACFPTCAALRFNRVEARMCGQDDRIALWDRLCTLLLSDNSRPEES